MASPIHDTRKATGYEQNIEYAHRLARAGVPGHQAGSSDLRAIAGEMARCFSLRVAREAIGIGNRRTNGENYASVRPPRQK